MRVAHGFRRLPAGPASAIALAGGARRERMNALPAAHAGMAGAAAARCGSFGACFAVPALGMGLPHACASDELVADRTACA
ncbi:hypothetical protein HLV35_05565 [Eggerthellaceae bacterium zg-997]|nr:hypothetical protein [Eggerthellaceae bacterium zg-997]